MENTRYQTKANSFQYSIFAPTEINWKPETERRILRSVTILGKWKLYENDEKYLLFHLKNLFVLKIFKFFSWRFGHVEKQLDLKDHFQNLWRHNLRSKLLQCIYALPSISRSKGNQTMKFGQLIKYIRNIFLEKSYTICGGETIPRLFPKKSNLHMSLDL